MSQITPIPAFSDNYIWLIREENGKRCAAVDPGDASPLLKVLEDEGLELTAILITHHHGDHTGGLGRLLQQFPDLPVYGPANEDILGLTHRVEEGDEVRLERMATFKVLDLPGHTLGHVAYLGDGNLFCGDTLFTCGCGRVFEGTMEEMHNSLAKLASLPPETRVYCAHEYTLDNIGFAKWVEPDSQALKEREEATHALISAGKPSVPSTIGLELATNPFLRTNVEEVFDTAENYAGAVFETEAQAFESLRYWKDSDYDS